MVDSSYDEMTTTEGNCNENLERNLLALRYPFAFVLRVRVAQIVCGICTLIMGAVAFIDEKSEINMGVGVLAGASMIIAAANSIYYSRGFDGYQPATVKTGRLAKFRFLGSTLRIMILNGILWAVACILEFVLVVCCIRTMYMGKYSALWTFLTDTYSPTITIIAGIQLILSTLGFIFMLIILWVDMHHDPDWQDPSDTIYSNNVTGVSMTTLSQSQSLTA